MMQSCAGRGIAGTRAAGRACREVVYDPAPRFASRSAARAASADRIAAAWLRRRAIAAADCGAHDTNAMYHIDDIRKNFGVGIAASVASIVELQLVK